MHTRQMKLMNTIEGIHCGNFELKSFPKHLAYLFEGSKLIAMSTNGWGRHAEMGILQYLRRDRQQILYVKRVRSGSTFMSRPCVRCSMSLKHVSPGLRVFYTNEVGDWVEDTMLNSLHRSRKDVGQPSVSIRLSGKRRKNKSLMI